VKKLVVELWGGLGNQMFQYAAGVDLARKTGKLLSLSDKKISRGFTNHGSHVREFLNVGKKYPSNFNRFHLSESMIVFLTEVFYRIFPRLILKPHEVGFSQLIVGKSTRRLAGYFQSWKLHEQVLEELKADFSSPAVPTNWYLSTKKEIAKRKILALHVRRGDYKRLKETFGLLSGDYYINAMEVLARSGSMTDEIWIFSDAVADVEMKGLQSKLQHYGVPVKIVIPPSDSKAAESLLLMSFCHSLVIANSTFSWWAARISTSRFIVRPSSWFVNGDEPIDLCPPGWLVCDSLWME
jgi:hypothetical protein